MKKRTKTNYAIQISTYPPRECGLATFTNDLVTAMNKRFNPALKSRVIALNEDPTSIYKYDNKVRYEMPATELESYVTTAKKINKDDSVKVVNIQHEFGIFGGTWGNYLVPFLQVVEKPVVITFHSVLPKPDESLKKMVSFLGDKSSALIVMNKESGRLLETKYKIPAEKIQYIPHGIPHTPFEPSAGPKTELGLENKTILSTFGLISPNKGIEYAIRALPRVVKRHPNICYLILGITHPVVRQQSGETYRNKLHREVAKLGLKDHVKFYNKYLSLEEVVQFLKATDVYLAPCWDVNQSVSGTLSYALGCGRPVISTASTYARHLVGKDSGILVRPKNHTDISRALVKLLGNPKTLKSMSTAAYEATRQMTWPNVARAYYDTYKRVAGIGKEERKFPEIKLDHLKRLTDNFGILHFAKYSTPETRYGYSLDDNARALIVAADYHALAPSQETERLMEIYLNFLDFTQRESGTFANIVSYSKKRDTTKDEDVQGRAIWALGTIAARDNIPKKIRVGAHKLFKKAIPLLANLSSPRAIAFSLTGLHTYLSKVQDNRLTQIFAELSEKQIDYYKATGAKDWQWFEDNLTYSNSKLPESLYYAYDLTHKKRYLTVAERTLDFLSQITFEPDYYSPIGQNGWYFRNKKRAYYDQQPEDTTSMIQAKLTAYKMTKDRRHLKDAIKAFEWFLGKNHLSQTVYDEVTGGCQDGVGEHAINLNQGAESTISYLLARLAFEDPEIKAKL